MQSGIMVGAKVSRLATGPRNRLFSAAALQPFENDAVVASVLLR
jgi:hypothetical protein